ncbi:MAG: 5-oxoprolinase subunit PxpA [Psychroserpens sp.]|uniref:5-oxoprolinase subunit PxpA n=1 Tax=Psychroserpens sp. TaxID=2020870 RepID=UPI0030023F7E
MILVNKIDINCDLGEGMGNEALLMPLISSCNIACGGHAGDTSTMETVVTLAKDYKVKIGAHPSFPDQENFGRKVLKMTSELLHNSIYEQIDNLKTILDKQNVPLHHIKPHGALYNLAAVDENTASIIVDVVKRFGNEIFLYVPFQSIISETASKEGLQVKFEAFADRNYNQDLTLVSRTEEHAVIHDSEAMFQHMYPMIIDGKVTAINGVEVELKADTFCVHGDGEDVVKNLKDLIVKLRKNNIEIS